MNNQRLYRIGELERLSGVPRRTILFYVESGLLHPPVKTGKTMAYYDEAHHQKLLFIKNGKKKKIPLVAIRQMIERREAEGDTFGMRLDERFVLERKKSGELRKPRKKIGKITRNRILQEGSRIFREKGYRNTRVSDITSYLNIGKGSFYSYFSNKDELFLECVPLIFREFFSRGWEEIRRERDPYRRILKRVEVSIPVIGEFTTILQLSREALKENDQTLKNLGESIYRSICKPIAADIEKGIEIGIFRSVDPGLYSALLLGIMESADNLLAMNPELTHESMKKAIMDVISRSLLTTSP
ncbi:MAG: MerR family transcriptional regulator [Deltaproteobacteria bacterium]|nr:MerR family transcriptional regulator [Deltaproteobacteria bacterium]